MGTRGAYGFHINGIDKVTYNHMDSYPSGLGMDVGDFIKNTSVGEMRVIAERIRLVDEDVPPTTEEMIKYAPMANTTISSHDPREWYVLLRSTQGDLTHYRDTDIDVMIDNHTFLNDSLFCEYAYIINLDDETLEYYKGCQKKRGFGRYANHVDSESGYFGVTLVGAVPLADIQKGVVPFAAEELAT